MPKVYTQFDPPPYEGAEMGGPCLVEADGYIPAERQIQNMLLAGERLIAGRREEYDFGPDEAVNMDMPIPHRAPGYDMADASQDARVLERKILEDHEEKKKELEKQAAAKKAAEGEPKED